MADYERDQDPTRSRQNTNEGKTYICSAETATMSMGRIGREDREKKEKMIVSERALLVLTSVIANPFQGNKAHLASRRREKLNVEAVQFALFVFTVTC